MTNSITTTNHQGQTVTQVPGQPGTVTTGRPERVEIGIPGADGDEDDAAAVECRPCKGRGTVQDTRTAAITHRVTTVNRTCRYCHGEGRITPIQPVVEWDTEIGEMPDWMASGCDHETDGAL